MNDEGLFYPTGVVQTFAEERDGWPDSKVATEPV